MIRDTLTVLWKESIEYMHMRGSRRGTILMMFLPLMIVGVFLPLQFGPAWIESPGSVVAWAWLPLLLTTAVIADSIAGERERHTLETLLASRLSDQSILFGKLLGSMFYALGLTGLIILAGVITVNVTYYEYGPILPSHPFLILGLIAGILGAAFASSVGILVSLRAATVRQAQQTLSFGVIVIAVLPGLLVNVLPPNVRADIIVALESMDGARAVASFFAALAFVDILLLASALKRFRRTRLLEQ